MARAFAKFSQLTIRWSKASISTFWDRGVFAARDENREGNRKHLLLHALDQTLFAFLHQLDVVSRVLGRLTGDLSDLLVRPALVVQVLQLSRKIHGPRAAAGQVFDERLEVGLFARARDDLGADVRSPETLVRDQSTLAANQLVEPRPGE